MHTFHTLAVFRAGGYYVYACGIDTAVTEDVGKLCCVFFYAIEYTGKQVAEIMREYLVRIDVCCLAELFHIFPDICAIYGLTTACNKDTAGCFFFSAAYRISFS